MFKTTLITLAQFMLQTAPSEKWTTDNLLNYDVVSSDVLFEIKWQSRGNVRHLFRVKQVDLQAKGQREFILRGLKSELSSGHTTQHYN